MTQRLQSKTTPLPPGSGLTRSRPRLVGSTRRSPMTSWPTSRQSSCLSYAVHGGLGLNRRLPPSSPSHPRTRTARSPRSHPHPHPHPHPLDDGPLIRRRSNPVLDPNAAGGRRCRYHTCGCGCGCGCRRQCRPRRPAVRHRGGLLGRAPSGGVSGQAHLPHHRADAAGRVGGRGSHPGVAAAGGRHGTCVCWRTCWLTCWRAASWGRQCWSRECWVPSPSMPPLLFYSTLYIGALASTPQ